MLNVTAKLYLNYWRKDSSMFGLNKSHLIFFFFGIGRIDCFDLVRSCRQGFVYCDFEIEQDC